MGEIYTPAHTCVYAQRKLDPGTELIEAGFDCGTDNSASWGPGIAVEWKNKRLKFYIRPGEKTFALWDSQGGEMIIDPADMGSGLSFDFSKPIYLRLLIMNSQVHCKASHDGKLWKNIAAVANTGQGDPLLVRIGKSSRSGGDNDYSAQDHGELTRSHVLEYAAYGAIEEIKGKQAGKGVTVSIHYNLYDSLPLISKWFTLENKSTNPIHLNTFTSEILAYVERDSRVEEVKLEGIEARPNMHIESDYQFFGMDTETANAVIHHEFDREYTSQVNYGLNTRCLAVPHS